jgi:hypothetical protein
VICGSIANAIFENNIIISARDPEIIIELKA